jgi:hypothetical protein
MSDLAHSRGVATNARDVEEKDGVFYIGIDHESVLFSTAIADLCSTKGAAAI